MARKRSSSGLDDLESQPTKVARKETNSAATDAILSANARIIELENQVKDLHAFIDAHGLTNMAPHSIRQHMPNFPGAAKALADQIMAFASKAIDELKTETLTEITSDDMSKAMMPFLDEVEGLRELPESTAVAFDLVMTLAGAGYSYGDLERDRGGYGDRPSDLEIDHLLVELAEERIKIEPFWNFPRVLDTLQDEAKHFSDYGIEDFCSDTIALLSLWQKKPPANGKVGQGR